MALLLVIVVVLALVAAALGGALLARSWPGGRAAPTDPREIVELVLSLSAERFGERSAVLDEQVRGVTGELHRVADLVAALQTEHTAQHRALDARLREAADQGRDLAATTSSLQRSLASPKARGQWGERMADDVLRLAGLVEGVNYVRQRGIAGGGIPDVTFLLPGDRVLHMDVKFPVDNYVRALEAPTPGEVERLTAAFLRDVRQRIREITTRAYIDPATTVDYVLLFIPNESVYSFMHEHDPGLIDSALGRQVVLCSPFTLFAVLAVIRQAMDSFRLEQVGDEILQCLGGFSAQWDKFSEQVDLVGRRFESTQKAYDDLAGTRRKALQRTIDQVDELRTRRGLGPIDAVEPDEPVEPGRLVATLRPASGS